jgi:hypothetical protein
LTQSGHLGPTIRGTCLQPLVNSLGNALWYGCAPQFEVPDLKELDVVAMPRFGIPHRESDERANKVIQVNWRRGLLRVWLLLSAAWIMGWVVYLIIYGIRAGFQSSGDFLAIPVLLIGPPIALFLFGLVAGWAVRGFKPE